MASIFQRIYSPAQASLFNPSFRIPPLDISLSTVVCCIITSVFIYLLSSTIIDSSNHVLRNSCQKGSGGRGYTSFEDSLGFTLTPDMQAYRIHRLDNSGSGYHDRCRSSVERHMNYTPAPTSGRRDNRYPKVHHKIKRHYNSGCTLYEYPTMNFPLLDSELQRERPHHQPRQNRHYR